jgi:glutamate-1-semialdehyde 2,1-aminomutase
LAKLICERIESVEKITFSCSATEACLSAVRLARGFTGKGRIVKLEGGYHGTGDAFVWSVHPDPFIHSGLPTNPKPLVETLGVPELLRGHTLVMPQNDLQGCERMIRENASDLAAVIFELQSGAGGLITLDKEFVEGMREITQKLGIVLIFDETVNLRFAPGGMQSAFRVKPDLTVMGKVIGGGFPIGAVGGSDEIMHLSETRQVITTGTHHGHAVSCAAGIASLEMLDQTACDRLEGLGVRIKSEMNGFIVKKKYPVNVTGMGDHIGFEMFDQPGRSVKSCRELITFCNDTATQVFNFELINRGYFPMWNRGQICTSTVIADKDIEEFIATCKEIMDWMYGS